MTIGEIKDILLDFPWDNYGLDELVDADTEWAYDLAASIYLAYVKSIENGLKTNE